MPRIEFRDLPAHGRLWVFPASRQLTDSEAEACLLAVDEFLSTWAAHGAPLRSAREMREHRFLLVGVDVDAEAPSGCSIDALVNSLRAFGADVGLSLIDHSGVWFRDAGEIRWLERGDFRARADQGSIAASVPVFDTTLTKVGELREGALERPAAETWHGRAFFRAHAGS